MDFIERLFGFSPDDGSGSTEMIVIGILVLVLVGIFARSRKKPAPQPDRTESTMVSNIPDTPAQSDSLHGLAQHLDSASNIEKEKEKLGRKASKSGQ